MKWKWLDLSNSSRSFHNQENKFCYGCRRARSHQLSIFATRSIRKEHMPITRESPNKHSMQRYKTNLVYPQLSPIIINWSRCAIETSFSFKCDRNATVQWFYGSQNFPLVITLAINIIAWHWQLTALSSERSSPAASPYRYPLLNMHTAFLIERQISSAWDVHQRRCFLHIVSQLHLGISTVFLMSKLIKG